ncbi:STAS domain-containing protein [Umezawaea sp. Da 62-37]|uniref:STAS domain-containing protein n=1 Tax=Umezawaea sp. Da 62-37 TaxID=3075927 RepID=UPI0028F73B43|nr:STAS domain-containing protein [Umezawaea sp. Da 62-37]WNV86339.1 STAS domain-containing protein [Umezawaea sp. Da 62-37]
MTGRFTATARPTPTGVVLRFAGELDAAAAPEARRVIVGLVLERGQHLVLDLSGLAFCDSSGISALLAARNTAIAADAGIALVAVPPGLARTFALIGLAEAFATYPTVEDADSAWTARS